MLAIGRKMPAWVDQGYREYARRLSGAVTLELVEIAAGGKAASLPVAQRMQAEAEQLLGRVGQNQRIVALDGRGKPWSTEDLAGRLDEWMMDGRDVALMIGGADGLDERVRAGADCLWSLGPLTLPHPLVRVVVAEQIYRAFSLNQGHPYHRAD